MWKGSLKTEMAFSGCLLCEEAVLKALIDVG